ncbi:N-acetyltransferase GCN5 [Clostridium bornimense]|uniref:N-acetyltransferase GCN5 n=1 Tax=Clostridium bornimense TaxID=1216932 RepID=W6SIJ0_9CLOT|nr:GNAT family N-acetyltransferase [Clostridium bornimense]CDM69470.1 N-acetyltransferase GCN5 [Clostridium bornimense]
MIREFKVNKKNGDTVKIIMKELDLAYIEKIMNLQENILNGIENKEIYAASTTEEFEEVILSKGKIIGCVTEEDDLIAMGVYVENGYGDHNYGYDLEIQGEELLKVCQIESTVVDEVYRGNRLQKIICEIIENIARERKMKLITATASPYNPYSVNTFKGLGYEIKKDKLKYGGLRRYILAKNV